MLFGVGPASSGECAAVLQVVLMALVATELLPSNAFPDGLGKVPAVCLQLWLGAMLLTLHRLLGQTANVTHTSSMQPKMAEGKKQKKKKSISFSLLQGWGCKAYNLCLFSVFFHCLIIAKYFI